MKTYNKSFGRIRSTTSIILLIAAIVLVSLLAFLKSGGDDDGDYKFAIIDSDKKEQLVLQIPKSSIAKFPGWKYERQGPFSISVWYPSLEDRVSYNHWISSSKDAEAGETKPNTDDRKLSISILSRISNPANTLDINTLPPQCELRFGKDKYIQDGESGLFKRFILDIPGSANLYIIYHPITPINGMQCIACNEKANCKLFGIADSGIQYKAFYKEERMPQEAMNIHQAIGQYLSTKIVEK